MVNPLILLHAFLAEIGLIAFLWIVVELLNPTESRIQRAQIAAVVGVCGLYLAWLFGGFYYVEVYGLHIKPLINASEAKWTHSIVMEVKEHVFLFLPILGTVILAFLLKFDKDKKRWKHWLFEAKKRFELIILNYTVTSNHIHLLVYDGKVNVIPKSIQLIAGRTAREF